MRELRSAGAKERGARWNRPGTEVIYAAASLALATLEFFVRLDRRVRPAEVLAHLIEIPDDVRIEHVDPAILPPKWESYPGPPELQDLGTGWVQAGRTLLLAVPSAMLRVPLAAIPTELNYLMNPSHPEFSRIRATAHTYRLDPRM